MPKKLQFSVIVLLGFLLFALVGSKKAEARYPAYVLLGPPKHVYYNGRAYYPGRQQTARAPSYAYGWFGVVRPEPRLGLVHGHYYYRQP